MGVSSALLPVPACSPCNVHWLSVFITALLILSSNATCVQCTTVEHDLHIVHNVDNRSPEIDPFWYVGRGVRPIGRFGKRQNNTPLHPTLELLLLNVLRNIEREQSTDYFSSVPEEVHKSFT
ncbi:prolactin releasing hormone 2 [Trichomycterus rosablanca]|uniref:prolactin releasing hormone 2 n=1 Tax=Trichomycterus rosablanca TaxID=2290929 RepID=UPI002F358D03